ncbi:MAG: hypothetical protein RIC30_15975 [Marinoscillum sp.]|uniref:hypothetical protein n=1 Tax=Marinoscillum sp. TaxID=2024838 RepID=UPI0032F39558
MSTSGIKSFRNLEPNNLIGQLIGYIDTQLPYFTSSDEFVEILALRKNENQYSTAFCVFMKSRCDQKFSFERENPQQGRNTIDIGVYHGAILFFTIEAKVLPTPLTGDRKEYEYVYGKGGGIQRFKDENHGVDNQRRLLPENAMIAYVKEQSFDHWFSTINQWVLDASWSENEKLEKLHFDRIARLTSVHPRIQGTEVTLHHFWVYVH